MTKNISLNLKKVLKFHEDGWLGPFNLIDEKQMKIIEKKIFSQIINPNKSESKNKADYLHNRHLDNRLIWNLCSHPNLVNKAKCLLGEDLICFRSNLQFKKSETNFKEGEGEFGEVPWHQDSAYYTFLPNIALTAWIAITNTTFKNGCLKIIPGSHHKQVPHDSNNELKSFQKKANPFFIDENESINVELKPGQFIFFNENLLHSSCKNISNQPRLGLSPRITPSFVFFPEWRSTNVLLLCGKDRFGHFSIINPPL